MKDEFPSENRDGKRHYFYYDEVGNVFRHCECGNMPNDKSTILADSNEKPLPIHDEPTKGCLFTKRDYTVIWRKK